jgi:outer membrane protein OmpA-like peptidoglycan-associated protein
MAERHARVQGFDRLAARGLCLVVTLLITSGGPGVSSAAAQFGAIGGAARRAAEEAKKLADEQKKKEQEAQQPAPAPVPAPAPATAAAAPTTAAAAAAEPTFASYSKFDFVPGELVVGVEDFTQDAIGDFPARWNTNASGEVVTIAGQPGRWLKLTRPGFFLPEFITALPDNFTLEFDFAVPPTADPGVPFTTVLIELPNPTQPTGWNTAPNYVQVTAHPSASGAGSSAITTRQDSTTTAANTATVAALTAAKGKPVHIAMWRQRQRVRVYMNEEKVWDLPRAFATSAKLNSVLFDFGGGCGNCEYYVANLRVATGAPDTRNKILTEGKWVTRGILFDVNSDKIKAESYGSLKEIAGVLTENADLKVQIVGHTDADGDEAANLDLSQRRAASVKTALAGEFKIDAARMDTDGKGESQPVDKNDNPAGKANNRRVEFIKK